MRKHASPAPTPSTGMTPVSRRALLAGGAALAFAGPALAQTVYDDAPPKPGEKLAADADHSRRIIPPPKPGYWDPYVGISGPGAPVTDATAGGGWTSGLPDVRYQGPVPRPYPTLPWGDATTTKAVRDGILPPIRPLWDVHIRDTIVCAGGDGAYYLTGSTGDNIWAFNDGVELWRSTDLKDWTYLGLVWSIERDGTWEKNWTRRRGVPFRAIWAPEIHYIAGQYLICTSISGVGIGILKSTTGKPEGPYVHAFSDGEPIKGSIDSTLFEDDDGRIWLTFGSADNIREIRRDLTGFAGDWQPIVFDEPDLNPDHHSGKDDKALRRMGYEGATLFKRKGTYYLGVVDKFHGRYSFAFATSKSITGPYRMRHEGVPGGGGGNVLRDHKGRWWQTYFGNDSSAPFREKPGMVRIGFDKAGKVIVHKDQPFARKP